MVFSSLIYLFLFLPICVIAYFAFPQMKVKNGILIGFSLLFYAWGEPVYFLLLVAAAAVNFGFGLLLDRYRGARHANLLLALAIVVDLAALVFFKYAGFFAQSLNSLLGTAIPAPNVRLPIGISFYTFQAMSYTIDVYKARVSRQKSFWKFLLYVSLFPQLIAGPIVRYSEIEGQLDKREVSLSGIYYGVFRFCVGLGKKVLLANYAGKTAALLLDGELAGATMVGVWFGMLMFAFEIYFDFSGYSDMAIGLGRVFGFKYAENFNLPYISKSITEFWRRWHISLGQFFRDYVYIPMGGNRRHQILNLLVVWALTGLWHGASWNFVLWGLYFFLLLLFEKKCAKLLDRVPPVLRHIATPFLLLLGWTIFYFTDPNRLILAVRVMFGAAGIGVCTAATGTTILNNLPLLVVCIIGATPLPRIAGLTFGTLCAVSGEEHIGRRQRLYVVGIFAFDLAILIVSTISLVGSSYNPFLYFRF